MKVNRALALSGIAALFVSALPGCMGATGSDDGFAPGDGQGSGTDNGPAQPDSTSRPSSTEGSGTGKTDRFGVTMLYPSKSGGEAWFLGEDPNRDPRFDPKVTVAQNDDGSWKMVAQQVRMNVFTSKGYGLTRTTDRETLAQQGYMADPADWKNVEITGFVKLNETSDESDNFCWYARGGRHNDAQPCEGSAYKGDLHFNGQARFGKESWHVSYDYSPYAEATKPLLGRWVGFKTVIRDVQVNGKKAVKLEAYLNDSADKVTWKKVYDFVDDGSWGGDSAECGARDAAMPLTWGGPVATYRWDSAEDVDFKWLSVREIQ